MGTDPDGIETHERQSEKTQLIVRHSNKFGLRAPSNSTSASTSTSS